MKQEKNMFSSEMLREMKRWVVIELEKETFENYNGI